MGQRGNDTADRLISFFELSESIPEVKRRLFIRLQLAVMFLLITRIVLSPILGFDWFNLVASLLMILFLIVWTWFLWRRRERQELLLFVVFFGSAAWLLMVMLYNVLQVPLESPNESLLHVASPWFIWLVLIYMVCFLTFRARSALRMSLMLSIFCMLLLLVPVIRAAVAKPTILYDFALLYVANILVISLAFPLAQTQERNSQTDFLTLLTNRNGGYSRLVVEIERAQRYEEMFAIILFDIDHFKKINDTCGHPCGDAVLREFGAFAGEHTRRTDLLCRWGGEEFLLIMTHTDLASARLKADHLRVQLKNRPFHQNIFLTASFGVTAYYPYDSANSMLERADEALYRAKRNGRNCVEAD